jgi:hypothetical protein
VYCKGGSRSAPACQLLVDHGYTNVYNMEGGITAWMQAGYPISTRYHHVDAENMSSIDIEPWLLYQAGCTTCQNQSCSSGSTLPTYSNFSVQENGTNMTFSIVGEVNGTSTEYTMVSSLLNNYTTVVDGTNRTASLWSFEIVSEGFEQFYYVLKYRAENDVYNFTVVSSLLPNELQTYNVSATYVSYDPVNVIPIKTGEVVNTNASLELSDYYKVLGKVAKELGREYNDSDDYSLQQLASGYESMRDELRCLSRIVKHQFADFDCEISQFSTAQMGVGLGVTDPEAISNGSFENGLTSWTVGGPWNGKHEVTDQDYTDGSHSLLLGFTGPFLPPVDTNYAYQLTSIPSNAHNIQFSFKYKLRTADSADYDRLEAYVNKVGGDPYLILSTGGATRGGYETFGWSTISASLSQGTYAGYGVYVYFSVSNGGDQDYLTYAYIDQVSITYDT